MTVEQQQEVNELRADIDSAIARIDRLIELRQAQLRRERESKAS